MTSPAYDVVIVFHVLAAVVGFGALGGTGAYAAALRRSADPFSDAALLRYFSPGRNWAGRAILLVPVLGATLLAMGHGRDLGHAWPWIGLAIWTVATALASSIAWPAEREIQRRLAAGAPGAPVPPGLLAAGRRAERAAAATSLLFVAALVVMSWQPG
jgi:uncharacterized membrane protein